MDTNTQISQPTFAEKLKSNTNQQLYPGKKLAILINGVENIPTKSFIIAIANLIGGKNITHRSRISNNRICVYLSNEKVVDDLIKNHRYITVENTRFEIRRLVNPARRIIISNIYPSIPNSIVEEAFQINNIKTVSPINFIKAGMQEDDLSHIMCFRRQVYVPENENIPNSLLITFDNTEYRIFLSEDIPFCIYCKERGHKAHECTSTQTNTTQNIQTNKPVQPIITPPLQTYQIEEQEPEPSSSFQNLNQIIKKGKTLNNKNNLQKGTQQVHTTKEQIHAINIGDQNFTQIAQRSDTSVEDNTTYAETNTTAPQHRTNLHKPSSTSQGAKQEEKEKVKNQNQKKDPSTTTQISNQDKNVETNKRPIQKTSMSDLSDNQEDITANANKNKKILKTISHTHKKSRSRSTSPSLYLNTEEITSHIRNEINSKQSQYILTFEQLQNFIDNAAGNIDPLTISKDYTLETAKLIDMMEKLYPLLHKQLKNKFTRIINRLKYQIDDEEDLTLTLNNT